ncbi:hypothetical protein [Vulgatibacter sp.]|uniref:hypothetical protein n=1 Tax=Vulgatibacter sp. TaxID=1971226 RepID=UPI003561E93F
MHAAQRLERALGMLLVFHKALKSTAADVEFVERTEAEVERISRLPLGQLKNETKQAFERLGLPVAQLLAILDKVVAQRNEVAHHFFSINSYLLDDPHCRVGLVLDLTVAGKVIGSAADAFERTVLQVLERNRVDAAAHDGFLRSQQQHSLVGRLNDAGVLTDFLAAVESLNPPKP